MKGVLFTFGVLLLLVAEIVRVYYIMPFPGSQQDLPGDALRVEIAFWLHNNIWWVRLIGLTMVVGPGMFYLRHGGWLKRMAVLVAIGLCGVVAYAFNFRLMADKMFLAPGTKVLRPVTLVDGTSRDLVIVVEVLGDARAYPIRIIGYHHQVSDTVGGAPVLITYCTVCRTGRAWSPVIDGEEDHFRLVGMDHFNAMFEDSRTGSWWRQVTGECIAGTLKGRRLQEVASMQMSLGEFARLHPAGLVMQPDPNFLAKYAALDGFDEGTIDSFLEQRDTTSWRAKSWVLGVLHNGAARAYDWTDLVALRSMTDTLAGDTIVIQLQPDNASFMVFRHGDQSGSLGQKPVPAYQEFWHSWRTFQPGTTRYRPPH